MACLLAIATASGQDQTGPEIRIDPPEAWLIVEESSEGGREEYWSYDSKEQAEAALAGMKRNGVVEVDSPDSNVRVNGICIFRPRHLTIRKNWLARNRVWIELFEPQARDTIVYTWEEGFDDDPLTGRRGGRAPMKRGASW